MHVHSQIASNLRHLGDEILCKREGTFTWCTCCWHDREAIATIALRSNAHKSSVHRVGKTILADSTFISTSWSSWCGCPPRVRHHLTWSYPPHLKHHIQARGHMDGFSWSLVWSTSWHSESASMCNNHCLSSACSIPPSSWDFREWQHGMHLCLKVIMKLPFSKVTNVCLCILSSGP